MIKQENIDIRVQRELFKKINSLNKFGRNSSNFVETTKGKGEDKQCCYDIIYFPF